jgi:hypothetical protein
MATLEEKVKYLRENVGWDKHFVDRVLSRSDIDGITEDIHSTNWRSRLKALVYRDLDSLWRAYGITDEDPIIRWVAFWHLNEKELWQKAKEDAYSTIRDDADAYFRALKDLEDLKKKEEEEEKIKKDRGKKMIILRCQIDLLEFYGYSKDEIYKFFTCTRFEDCTEIDNFYHYDIEILKMAIKPDSYELDSYNLNSFRCNEMAAVLKNYFNV